MGTELPPTKGAHQPPLFGWCLLWPRSDISTTAELLFLFGIAISDLNVVIFAGKSSGLEPTIFASQPAGLTEGLSARSGDENLDRFHLCIAWQSLLYGSIKQMPVCIFTVTCNARTRFTRFRQTRGLPALHQLHVLPEFSPHLKTHRTQCAGRSHVILTCHLPGLCLGDYSGIRSVTSLQWHRSPVNNQLSTNGHRLWKKQV